MNYLHNDKRLKNAEFAKKTNWSNSEYQYLKNVNITEWDIKSAGLSVIKFEKLLPEDEIKKLENMTKQMRTVREGLFQKENPTLAEKIVKTLEKVRFGFAYMNNISSSDVLSIKKDAIFLVNKVPEITTIKDYFIFREKSSYSSYIKLNKNEFYLKKDGKLDIKGINSENIRKQENFLLKDIAYFLRMSEKLNPSQMFSILKNYRKKYLNKELPIETYRELDSGLFRLSNNYFPAEVDDSVVDMIDISQNYMNYILPMINMLL